LTTKRCSRCKEYKELSEFNKCSSCTLGVQNNCRECHNYYGRKWHQENKESKYAKDKIWKKENPDKVREYGRKVHSRYRKEWIEFLKSISEHVCVKCGYDSCFAALDYHHLRDKEFPISKMIQNKPTDERKELVKIEIEKCVILCCRCHRELHDDNSGDYLEPDFKGEF